MLRLFIAMLLALAPLGHDASASFNGLFADSTQPTFLSPDDAFSVNGSVLPNNDLSVEWHIAKGYYLYRDRMQLFTVEDGRVHAVPIVLPPGTLKVDPNFGDVDVFHDTLLIQIESQLAQRADAQVVLTYQGCADEGICYPPIVKAWDRSLLAFTSAPPDLILPLPSEQSKAPRSSDTDPDVSTDGRQTGAAEGPDGLIGALHTKGGLLGLFLAFLGFGVLLSFTPCVFPMFPILAGALASQGSRLTRKSGFVLSTIYVVAMACAYATLGIFAAWSGRNLQMVLQSPWAIGAMAVLFLLLALSMFGAFNLQSPSGLSSRLAGIRFARLSPPWRAAGLGFTSALIVGPCVTPPLAGALIYIGQTGDIFLGASLLFVLGFGMGLPLIAAATIGVAVLPKAGAWMDQVKLIFGAVFLAMALWMAGRILPGPIVMLGWAVALNGVGFALGTFTTLPATPMNMLKKSLGALAFAYAFLLIVGAVSNGSSPTAPLSAITGQRGMSSADISGSLHFDRATTPKQLSSILDAAKRSNQRVFLDFTAEWCTECTTFDREVLSRDDVKKALNEFVRIKVDLTDDTPGTRQLLADWGVVGPPTLVLLTRTGAELKNSRRVGAVDANAFLEMIALSEKK